MHVIPSQIKTFKHNGMWIAISIVQDGHAFPLLLPAIYVVNRDITLVSIHDKEIPDRSVKYLIESVCQFIS